jgi:hypothetical protein
LSIVSNSVLNCAYRMDHHSGDRHLHVQTLAASSECPPYLVVDLDLSLFLSPSLGQICLAGTITDASDRAILSVHSMNSENMIQ